MCMPPAPLKRGGKTAMPVRDCELAPWVKRWPCKLEDRLQPRQTSTSQVWMPLLITPVLGAGADRRTPEAWFSERPCLGNKVEDKWGRHLTWTSCLHTYTHTYTPVNSPRAQINKYVKGISYFKSVAVEASREP